MPIAASYGSVIVFILSSYNENPLPPWSKADSYVTADAYFSIQKLTQRFTRVGPAHSGLYPSAQPSHASLPPPSMRSSLFHHSTLHLTKPRNAKRMDQAGAPLVGRVLSLGSFLAGDFCPAL